MYTVIKHEKGGGAAVRSLLKKILEKNLVDGVFVSAATPYSRLPMPAICTDIEKLEAAQPLAPVAPFNAARQAAALLRHDTGKRIAVVLRPCEIRALVELVKLKQADLGPAVIIGMECRGRMENSDFLAETAKVPDLPPGNDPGGLICTACGACERFLPEGSDLVLNVFGEDIATGIGLSATSDTGIDMVEELGYGKETPPAEHDNEIEREALARREAKSRLMEATSEKINTIEAFETLIANCLNCYNCRVACPVCYCKECVFLTDVFAHDPELLLRRAAKRGMVKMPTETTMFHLTRLAHIGHACVACGHCTSVCPSNIPVADFFITVGDKVQGLFDYVPGRDVAEPIPYLVFEEKNKTK
jgi:formate dehydrogenase (coenzyme F420) beta subunit